MSRTKIILLAATIFLVRVSSSFATLDADVLMSYSPGAVADAGGEGNIQVWLSGAIGGANTVHDNSGTGIHWHIAGFYLSTAAPAAGTSINTVLGNLSGDASYQDVRDYSVAVGADCVNYIANVSGASGLAYLPGNYSVVNDNAAYYVVIAHEIGHNYGANHADGLGFTGNDNAPYRTIMLHNYCGGSDIPYYSNPNIYYKGVQLLGSLAGDCGTGSLLNNGNNAGILANYAATMANTRQRQTTAPNFTNTIYHWSFTNAPGSAFAGTTISDSVSSAPAIVRGTNAIFTGSALRIPGGTTGNVAANSLAAYIDLPNGIISAQTNLTIEIWATPLSTQNWQRLCDFGSAVVNNVLSPGEITGAINSAAPGTTSAYDEFSLSLDVAVSSLGSQRLIGQCYGFSTNNVDAALPTLAGAQQHYAIVFQDGIGTNGASGGRITWYRNGDAVTYEDVKFHLYNFRDVNNWLGRSQWSADSQANADYSEVRISNVALTPAQVKANFSLGANFVPTATAPAIAGNLYVDLRAGYAAATTWTNLGALGNFSAIGSPVITTNVGGTGISGIYFDGVSAAFQGPVTVADLEGKSDRTIEVWAYEPTLGDQGTLVSWSHRNTTDVNMAFCYGTNTSWGAAQHWADDLSWGSSVPSAGAWHHLVYTSDGAGNIKVYADDFLQNSRALSGTQATASGEPINLGCQRDSANGNRSIFFNGYLNSVRVHGGILTPQQIWNNYLVGPSVAPTNVPSAPAGITAASGAQQISLAWNSVANIAGYKIYRGLMTGGPYPNISSATLNNFTDTNVLAGTNYFYVVTAVNLVGESTYSVEVSGTPTALPTGPNTTGNLFVNLWASGANSTTWTNYGSFSNFTNATGSPIFVANVAGTGIPGVYFNGSSAFAGQTTVSGLEGNSARTVEVWAYSPALSAEPTMVSWGYRGGTDCNFAFNFGNDATFGAATHIGDDVSWGATPPGANAWHHLVYTYDGSGMVKLFVDGQLRNAKILMSQLGTIAGMPVNLGCQRDFLATRSHFFTGYLNSVRVQGGALTAPQVYANYLLGPTVTPPTAFTRIWRGDGASNVWDTAASTNWFNGTARDYFYAGNNVTFDDSATNLAVNFSSTVLPGSVLINSTSNYLFAGAGKISGYTSLVKINSGTLTLANTNDYSGATIISGGTLKLKPQLDAIVHLTFDNVSGSAIGSIVTNTGAGGAAMNAVVTSAAVGYVAGKFGNAVSFSGNGAYLKITNRVAALDATGSWTVAFWLKTSTAGAAYLYQGDGGWGSGNTQFYLNSGNTSAGGTKVGCVRYAGNWTVGTTAVNNNQWHFIVITDNGGTQSIYLDGNPDTVAASMANVSVGSQIWVGGRGDTGDGTAALIGQMDEFYMFARGFGQSDVTALMNANNPGNPPILPATTSVSIASGSAWNLAGASQTVASFSGATNSNVILGENTSFGILSAGDATTNNFAGNLTGSGMFTKLGAGALTLGGSNFYTGATTVSAGQLFVNGQLGTGAVLVASSALLGGGGKILSPVTIQPGAIFSPGNSIGTLTISSSLSLTNGATTILEIAKTGGVTTNDFVTGVTSLKFGGTLTVTNLGPDALAAGDTFQLFNAASYSGTFSATNLPPLGNNLYWTNQLSLNGSLAVALGISTVPANIIFDFDGTNLILSWPADHLGWRLLMQTNNLDSGVSLNTNDWMTFAASQQTNQVTAPIDPALPAEFYRLVYP